MISDNILFQLGKRCSFEPSIQIVVKVPRAVSRENIPLLRMKGTDQSLVFGNCGWGNSVAVSCGQMCFPKLIEGLPQINYHRQMRCRLTG